MEGAILTREKSQWFTDYPSENKCLEWKILHSWTVSDFAAPSTVPEAFYRDLFDACTLDYSQEPRVYSWPQ